MPIPTHEVNLSALRSLITTRTIEQFFDPVKSMFLPDRYIKGECPKCGAKDQYGNAISALSAYTVSVSVVSSSALGGIGSAAARRIDVTVTRSPNVTVTLSGYRTNY